jgi:hypothetical protein
MQRINENLSYLQTFMQIQALSKRYPFLLLLHLSAISELTAQSYRGISITSDSFLWFSGTQNQFGIYALKSDSIHTNSIKLNSIKDFRDIQALNKKIAFAISIADSGVVMRTDDGGVSWAEVFCENDSGVFFDAIEMDSRKKIAVLFGDPLPQSPDHFYFRLSLDSGNRWIKFADGTWNQTSPKLNSLFAASGSSVKILDAETSVDKKNVKLSLIIAGGGPKGASLRVVKVKWNRRGELLSESSLDIPLKLPEEPSWGVYALSEIRENNLIVAGGNWQFIDGIFQGKSHSSVWHLSWNKKFLKNLKENDNLVIKDLNIASYISGVSLDSNGNFAGVGNQGVYVGNIFQTTALPHFIPLDPRFKNYHAVSLFNQHIYILGSSQTMKILKMPIHRE